MEYFNSFLLLPVSFNTDIMLRHSFTCTSHTFHTERKGMLVRCADEPSKGLVMPYVWRTIYISHICGLILPAHMLATHGLPICTFAVFHKFSGNSSLPSSLPICTFAVFTSLVGTPSLPYNPYTSILLNTRWFYTMTITLNVVGGKLPHPIVDTAASY